MNILNKIIAHLKKALNNRGTAYLFGSRARGTGRDDSDWDVLVILDKECLDSADYDEITFPLSYLGWEENQTISPIMYTRNEWQKQSFTPFFKNVEREKIVLV
ncbi:MAG: nucleotidyltransferase domain-containing protein [Muribaculaceae bacterium]|nr:nucleotidyltransferase domain-containing protein [Muribaculaceae bacterium]